MGFMEQLRRVIFGPPKRRKRKSAPKKKRAKKVQFYVKESYTQDELRALVKQGKARVKPHRKG